MKKILIAGGAGFLGSNLCEKLIQDNHVICLDNLSTGNIKNIEKFIKQPNFEFIEHDIIEPIDFEINEIKTTWLVQGYFNDFLHSDLSIMKQAENIENYLNKINKYSNDACLLPIGADHLGMLKDANKKLGTVKICCEYEVWEYSTFRKEKYDNDGSHH